MGVTLDVTVTEDAVTGALARLNKQGGDLRPFFANVAASWVERIAMSFRTSTSPYGAIWKPLKSRVGQPLLDTGRLRNSFSSRIGPKSAIVGTNVGYARIHNEGGVIERAPHSTMVRLRTTKGGGLLKQPGHPNLAIFAKNKHKSVRTSWHPVGAYRIPIPQRQFMPTGGALPRAWQDDVYRAFVRHMGDAGVKV